MLLTYTCTCWGYAHSSDAGHLIRHYSLIFERIKTFKSAMIIEVFNTSMAMMINQLCIADYPVKAFSGRKKLIISTVSWIGGRNNFLGIAYMVVGVLCILLALIFLIIHCKIGKR